MVLFIEFAECSGTTSAVLSIFAWELWGVTASVLVEAQTVQLRFLRWAWLRNKCSERNVESGVTLHYAIKYIVSNDGLGF